MIFESLVCLGNRGQISLSLLRDVSEDWLLVGHASQRILGLILLRVAVLAANLVVRGVGRLALAVGALHASAVSAAIES